MRNKKFQLEIRLGLAIIVLVLIILNFASHYTLFRIRNSVQSEINDNLTEAAIVLSNKIKVAGNLNLTDSLIIEYKYRYKLNNLSVEPLDYDRVRLIQTGQLPTFAFLKYSGDLPVEDISPIIRNEAVVYHEKGSKSNIIIFPFDFIGSKHIIGVERESSLLSSIEQAGTILLFAGLLGIAVILYASFKFVRYVIYPFNRLKEEAARSGRLVTDDKDEVADLITSYESIIVDLKANENELKSQMALIMEMSGGLAHQLRNAMSGIVGFARLIEKRGGSEPTVQKNIISLLNETREAEQLVRRFLDFARPLKVQYGPVGLNDLFKSIKENLTSNNKHTIIIMPETDEIVPGDRLLLKQAFGNIIHNAVHAFGEPGGVVQINWVRIDSRMNIEIIDDGPGIPEDYRHKIFAPFFSGSPSGTGLGLSLAKKIIAGHGGKISYDSHEGQGTRFTIELPMVHEDQLSVAAEVPNSKV